MSQNILGIDVGSYSIKVAHLSRALRDFELKSFQEIPINLGGRLTHEEAVAAGLKAYFERNEIQSDLIAVSLPAHHCSMRVVEMPFTNLSKIDQTIEFELESYIPISIDEMVVDYHILSMEENLSRILVGYISRTRFAKYLDMLQIAGIDPKYVGIDCIDLSNVAQVAMVPQDTEYAIIDIGHSKSNICVMRGTELIYARSITIGGVHFSRAIQKVFKLSVEKAESLKIDRGKLSASEDNLDQISRICQKVAEEMVTAIRQTYLGFKKYYKKEEWGGIYLTGGGSRMQGLSEMISSSLRINVCTLDCIDFIDHQLNQVETIKDIIAPSLSQTLRVIFSNKAAKINFRKGEFAYKRDIKALGGEIKQLGVWFAVVLSLGLFYFFFSYHALSNRIEKLNKDLVTEALKSLPEFKDQKKKMTAKQLLGLVNGKISEIDGQLEAFKTGLTGATPLVVLQEISKSLPPKTEVKIDVDDFTFTGDVVRLEGRTISFEAVDKIKNALSSSKLFKNVTTQNVVKGIRDEIKFSVSMEVNIDVGEQS